MLNCHALLYGLIATAARRSSSASGHFCCSNSSCAFSTCCSASYQSFMALVRLREAIRAGGGNTPTANLILFTVGRQVRSALKIPNQNVPGRATVGFFRGKESVKVSPQRADWMVWIGAVGSAGLRRSPGSPAKSSRLTVRLLTQDSPTNSGIRRDRQAVAESDAC